ncbi:MAG: bifunctional 2-polyprenyl-6-hydroxyphenol methylase/3-demethylubiquinol 3-O-methyltransferase UbiG [Proteobacteria bacterium]|nr:bifunctional 2-polyprenyl-6-hydroxyphenol methylase/3-demethylubiquinol 3-O-methyltransferase UbiG [Pseudomonadota bacterium]
MTKVSRSTIDRAEQAKFAQLADQWWREDGAFSMLHKMSRVRMAYIAKHLKLLGPHRTLEVLDVGCGGGLASVPMARKGHNVLGIDMVAENIEAATIHARSQKIWDLKYHTSSIENLVAEQKHSFDVVMALEIVEHVADLELFCSSCATLLKPGGLLFISTINKTTRSYLGAIIMAEYLLRWVPIGTHDWQRFIGPQDLSEILATQDLRVIDITGMQYNPIKDTWRMSNDQSMNYILCARKPLQKLDFSKQR